MLMRVISDADHLVFVAKRIISAIYPDAFQETFYLNGVNRCALLN